MEKIGYNTPLTKVKVSSRCLCIVIRRPGQMMTTDRHKGGFTGSEGPGSCQRESNWREGTIVWSGSVPREVTEGKFHNMVLI